MSFNTPDDCGKSSHWDDNESYCPGCGQTMTEINQGEQLQCDDKVCGEIIDNNRG